jgi:hypothetical protein
MRTPGAMQLKRTSVNIIDGNYAESDNEQQHQQQRSKAKDEDQDQDWLDFRF